jgi:hypothetical protein
MALYLDVGRSVPEYFEDEAINMTINKLWDERHFLCDPDKEVPMAQLPRIFDERGVFAEPDHTGLDEQTLARLEGVRSAYANLKAAEAAEQAAINEVTDSVQALADAEEFQRRYFPPSTFFDEWKAMVRGR